MTDEGVPAFHRSQKIEATVQCNFCEYWGTMEGYVDPADRDVIQFVCPSCQSIEKVINFL